MEKKIKDFRGVKQSSDGLKRLYKENQRQNFRELLDFKENQIFETKEYSIIKQIKKVFIRHKILINLKLTNILLIFIFLHIFCELKLMKMGIMID